MANLDTAQDIRDLAPPPPVSDPLSLWVYVAIAGATLLAAGLLAYFAWLNRRPSTPPIPEDLRKSALDLLRALRRDHATIAPVEFGARTIDGLRLVLAQRFGRASLSETPDEFFDRHRRQFGTLLGAGRDGVLARLLSDCDHLRFAPDPDAPSARLPLVEAAIAFVLDLPEFANNTSPTSPDHASSADAHPAVA